MSKLREIHREKSKLEREIFEEIEEYMIIAKYITSPYYFNIIFNRQDNLLNIKDTILKLLDIFKVTDDISIIYKIDETIIKLNKLKEEFEYLKGINNERN